MHGNNSVNSGRPPMKRPHLMHQPRHHLAHQQQHRGVGQVQHVFFLIFFLEFLRVFV